MDKSAFYKGSIFKSLKAITWLGYKVQEVQVTAPLKAWMKSFGLPGIGLLATEDKQKVQTVTYTNQKISASVLSAAQQHLLSLGSTLISWDRKLYKWISHYIMIDIDNEFDQNIGIELLNYMKKRFNIKAFLYETPSSRIRLALYSSEPISSYKATSYAESLKSLLTQDFPTLKLDRTFPNNPCYTKAACVFLFKDLIYTCKDSKLIPIKLDYNQTPQTFFETHDLNNAAESFKTLSDHVSKRVINSFPRKIRRRYNAELLQKINQLLAKFSVEESELDKDYEKALSFWSFYKSNYIKSQRNDIAKALFAKGLKHGFSGKLLLQAFIDTFQALDEELDKRVEDLWRTYDRYINNKPISTSYFLKTKELTFDNHYMHKLCSKALKDSKQLKVLLEFLLYRSNCYNVIYFGLDTIRKLLKVSQEKAHELRSKLIKLRFIKLHKSHKFIEGRKFANEYVLNWYAILDFENTAEDSNDRHLLSNSSFQYCSRLRTESQLSNALSPPFSSHFEASVGSFSSISPPKLLSFGGEPCKP